MAFASFSGGGWYPKATRGKRRFKRIVGLRMLPFCQTGYGMPLGLGVEEGNDLLRECLISSFMRRGAEDSRDRRPLRGQGCFSGKR